MTNSLKLTPHDNIENNQLLLPDNFSIASAAPKISAKLRFMLISDRDQCPLLSDSKALDLAAERCPAAYDPGCVKTFGASRSGQKMIENGALSLILRRQHGKVSQIIRASTIFRTAQVFSYSLDPKLPCGKCFRRIYHFRNSKK